jgi:deaminated glutathione amidase
MLSSPLLPPRKTTVAVAQMCSTPDVAANLEQALTLVDEAAGNGAELVCLPENTLYLRVEDAEQSPLLLPSSEPFTALCRRARELGVWLLVGSLPEDSGDPRRPYNTSVLVDSAGDARASYRKLHLFRLRAADGEPGLDESRTSSAGDRPVLARTPFGGIGLSICYDLRFPELYRAHVAAGATILTVPAAFTERTGRVHWRMLLRARAVENQAFVVAPAQAGHHGGHRRSWGHSLIADPWGEILAEVEGGPGVALAELDPKRITEVRDALPALRDVSLELPWKAELVDAV